MYSSLVREVVDESVGECDALESLEEKELVSEGIAG